MTIQFTVQGFSIFPLDMLRYDACYPSSSSDAVELNASFDVRERQERREKNAPFAVQLLSNNHHLEERRWQSFGWRITNQTKL